MTWKRDEFSVAGGILTTTQHPEKVAALILCSKTRPANGTVCISDWPEYRNNRSIGYYVI